MKGAAKIALTFGLLGGLMAYFIIPVQFSRKRTLSPTEKAEYALTVDYYRSHARLAYEEGIVGATQCEAAMAAFAKSWRRQ
jgi:hypothetical protein